MCVRELGVGRATVFWAWETLHQVAVREPEYDVGQGTVGSLTTTVLIAGDDADAKSTLAGVITSGGLNAIDAGSLKRAHELESLGFLQISLAANEKIDWTCGFGVVA